MVIYVVGDNGASGEGTLIGTTNNMMVQNGFPDTVEDQLEVIDGIGGKDFENHYAVPWAWAGSSPFQWMKRVPSHFGGTRNGLIVSWPEGIKAKNEKRTQFHHVVDIAPTIYEAAGIEIPTKVNGVEQSPMAGVPMNYSFDGADKEGTRKTQYFEVAGHMAIYHDGWMASAFHGVPWAFIGSKGFDDVTWELYNIDEDFSQANDLAKSHPEKLEELKKIFDEEANKYDVYPLDDRYAERVVNPNRPSITRGKKHFRYYQAQCAYQKVVLLRSTHVATPLNPSWTTTMVMKVSSLLLGVMWLATPSILKMASCTTTTTSSTKNASM